MFEIAVNDASRHPTARFLQACLRSRWDSSSLQIARAIAEQTLLDWESVCQMACDEALSALLYTIVRDQHLVPPHIEEQLSGYYYNLARRNLLLFDHLKDVLRCLEAAGIATIVLKGAALAEMVYGNIAVRPMVDLDLLIRRGDVPAALEALAGLGYKPLQAETQIGDTLTYENEVVLSDPAEKGLYVEVHWGLVDSPFYQEKIEDAWLWDSAQRFRMGDTWGLMLGFEAQVLHLCAHLLLHHGGERWLWLHDIAEVIHFSRTNLDWDQVLTQCKAYDLVLPVQSILVFLADEWGVTIPTQVMQQVRVLRPSLRERRVFTWLTKWHHSVAYRFWGDVLSISDWERRLHYIQINLFPAAAYMRHRYRLASPWLLPLSYPYRWFLGLTSLLRLLATTLFQRRSGDN